MYDVIRDQKVNFGFFFPEMTLLDIPEMYQIGVKQNLFQFSRVYYYHPDFHEHSPVSWHEEFDRPVLYQAGIPTLIPYPRILEKKSKSREMSKRHSWKKKSSRNSKNRFLGNE